MALLALSDSFEYLWYGSAAIRNILILTVQESTLDVIRNILILTVQESTLDVRI